MSKAPLILLINPWITDFAAHDLWAKPMGLLLLASLLRISGLRVEFVDCLDRHDPVTTMHPDVLPGKDKKFGAGKYPRMSIPKPEPYSDFPRYYYRHGIHPESLVRKLQEIEKPDLVWVTSAMTYWYPGVRETVQAVRRGLPDVPVWVGGTYAKLCPGHAAGATGADLVFTGALRELPSLLSGQTGFAIKDIGPWSDFRFLPAPAIDLLPKPGYVPLLTSVGCPYRCPYCASGTLQPEWKRSSPEKVYEQVSRAHDLYGVSDFAFYDDALLLDAGETLIPALDRIAREGPRVRFHVPNALHIRALSRDVCSLLRESGFRTIRLGLETTTDEKSRTWGGKVSTTMFFSAVANLLAAGFKGEEIGVYLLAGVPDQTPGEVADSVAAVLQAGVTPRIAEYSPIPGTPMWRSAAAQSSFDLEGEPLYHNNTFFACRRPGFTYEDMLALKRLARPSPAERTPPPADTSRPEKGESTGNGEYSRGPS